MKTTVGIVGYGMGNIMSLCNAVRAVEADVFVAECPHELDQATHLILPGVGAFPKGMEQLRALGFDAELRRLVLGQQRPLLGVCLGMQLLASWGEEHRECEGLGFVPGRVTHLQADGLRIPHVGWNDTVSTLDNRLFGRQGTQTCFYYVHSYHLIPDNPTDASMTCDYGQAIVAAVERGNIFGVQFHPEKSHIDGLQILKQFIEVPVVETPLDSMPVFAERVGRQKPGISRI
jgi:glutamine amidotransferase